MTTIANIFLKSLSLAMSSLSIFVSNSRSSEAKMLPPIAQELAPYVREVLQLFRGQHAQLLDIATFLVAIGVVLEGPEIRYEWQEKFSHFKIELTPPKMPKWIAVCGLVGWLMIVLGVGGELFFESWLSTDNEEIQGINDDLLRTTQAQSGNARDSARYASIAARDAQTSADNATTAASGAEGSAKIADEHAKDAQRKVTAVGQQASTLEQRIADLNGEIVAIEPRAVVITEDDGSLLAAVSPYAEQKFEAQILGYSDPLESVSREKMDAAGSLVNLLQIKAKWDWDNHLHLSWEKKIGLYGIHVVVNMNGPPKTIKAAHALSEELTKILPEQPMPILAPVWSDPNAYLTDPQSPFLWSARNPDVICILVGDRMPLMRRPAAKPNTPKAH